MTQPSNAIRISNWRPIGKNTLVGAFTVHLPSGLIIHDVMVHQKETGRWIQFPSREWTNQQGERQFMRFIEFDSRERSDAFRDLTLSALDAFLEKETAKTDVDQPSRARA
jgi:DNA-binding cell septation regulator SpoVG